MKKIFYTILLLATFSSCKDYLDLKGNNTQAVPTTLADLQALLNEVAGMNGLSTPSMVEYWCDDYYLPLERYENLMDVFQGSYIWELKDFTHPNDWSTGYRPIYNANFCLEGLQRIARNKANSYDYDQILGASLFFRAYYFQQLLWAFAPAYDAATAATDIGIVLKEDTDFNTPSIRSSVQAGYDRVIKDLEEALPLLPDLPSIPTQPSKAATHALLARTYLSMRIYDAALHHADEALKLKSDLLDFNKKTVGVDPSQLYTFQKYNNEVIFYSEVNHYRGNLASGAPIDSTLLRSYADADLRSRFYFLEYGGYHIFRGSYANNYMFSGLATDELYLIKAECLARAGEVNHAIDVVNYFLRYRYDALTTYIPLKAQNKTEALDIVLLERRKSLLFRGLRLQDIKRLNKEGREIALVRKLGDKVYRMEPNDPRLVQPIPDDLRGFVK